jgi:hypothetical protein
MISESLVKLSPRRQTRLVRGFWNEIRARTAQGVSLSRIASDLGIDRKTARKHRDAESDPETVPIVRHRPSRFAEHEAYIREQLGEGVRISQIARELERRAKQRIPYSSLWEYARSLTAPTTD